MAEPDHVPLLELPREILDIVCGRLHRRYLTKVALTCKTLKSSAVPKLYKHIIIRVPLQWSRLPSFESLASCSSESLENTRIISLHTQHDPLRPDQRWNEDSQLPFDVAVEHHPLFVLPAPSASNALNVLIRLLVSRLPRHRLQEFTLNHNCVLDVTTLSLILANHGQSLDSLSFNGYVRTQELPDFVLKGLTRLIIHDLNTEAGGEWPGKLIKQSRESLKFLQLGIETSIAQEYAATSLVRQTQLPASFAQSTRKALGAVEGELVNLSLNVLNLFGLEPSSIFQGHLGIRVDFDNLKALRLFSCPGLYDALATFTANIDSSSTLKPLKLKGLFIRHEARGAPYRFGQVLERFLTSFCGLNNLEVMVEGTTHPQNLRPILAIHGKTLHVLLWDERKGPRTRIDVTTSNVCCQFGNLTAIAQHCPRLVILALTLNWSACVGSNTHHSWIMNCFTRMKRLQLLNIRNMPELPAAYCPLALDYTLKGLATMFIDIADTKRNPKCTPLLKIIAIGAPLYRDNRIGTNQFPDNHVVDFLQLRVYHVDYDYQSGGTHQYVLSQVAKGTQNEVCGSLGIRDWLWCNWWLG